MFVSALKSNQELTTFPPALVPGDWVWQNFIDAVNYIPFGLYALNSFDHHGRHHDRLGPVEHASSRTASRGSSGPAGT